MVVEALYDCNPDHRDELGFQDGERLIVTKKLNRDWWVSMQGETKVTSEPCVPSFSVTC